MEAKRFTIYFTSDLHGYIYPTDYRSREERDMGLFKCASQFRKDGNTLVIDGGDILQGSPLGAFCHDTVGSAASNDKLSLNRAKAIASWFRKHGLSIPTFYRGAGERSLAVPTPDNTPNEKNRRAVYILSNRPPLDSADLGGFTKL